MRTPLHSASPTKVTSVPTISDVCLCFCLIVKEMHGSFSSCSSRGILFLHYRSFVIWPVCEITPDNLHCYKIKFAKGSLNQIEILKLSHVFSLQRPLRLWHFFAFFNPHSSKNLLLLFAFPYTRFSFPRRSVDFDPQDQTMDSSAFRTRKWWLNVVLHVPSECGAIENESWAAVSPPIPQMERYGSWESYQDNRRCQWLESSVDSMGSWAARHKLMRAFNPWRVPSNNDTFPDTIRTTVKHHHQKCSSREFKFLGQ